MDIVSVLLFTSALIGVAAGLRFKVFVLVPIGLLIALVSAAALQINDFGGGSGIATVVACLILNQAAYLIAHLLSDHVTDREPSPGREQDIHGDDGDHGN